MFYRNISLHQSDNKSDNNFSLLQTWLSSIEICQPANLLATCQPPGTGGTSRASSSDSITPIEPSPTQPLRGLVPATVASNSLTFRSPLSPALAVSAVSADLVQDGGSTGARTLPTVPPASIWGPPTDPRRAWDVQTNTIRRMPVGPVQMPADVATNVTPPHGSIETPPVAMNVIPLTNISLSGKIANLIHAIPQAHQSTIAHFIDTLTLANHVPDFPLSSLLEQLSSLSNPILKVVQSLDATHWDALQPIASELLSIRGFHSVIIESTRILQRGNKADQRLVKDSFYALKAVVSILPPDPNLLLLWVEFCDQINPAFKQKAVKAVHDFLFPFSTHLVTEHTKPLLDSPIRIHPDDAFLSKDDTVWGAMHPALQAASLARLESRPYMDLVKAFKLRRIDRIRDGRRHTDTASPNSITLWVSTLTDMITNPIELSPTPPATLTIVNSTIEIQGMHITPERLGLGLAQLGKNSTPIIESLTSLFSTTPSHDHLFNIIKYALLYNPKYDEIRPLLTLLTQQNVHHTILLLLETIPNSGRLDEHVLLSHLQEHLSDLLKMGIHLRVWEWVASTIPLSTLKQAGVCDTSLTVIKALMPLQKRWDAGDFAGIPTTRLALFMIIHSSELASNPPPSPPPLSELWGLIQKRDPSVEIARRILMNTPPSSEPPSQATKDSLTHILELLDPLHQIQYPTLSCALQPFLNTSPPSHPIIERLANRMDAPSPSGNCSWLNRKPPIHSTPYTKIESVWTLESATAILNQTNDARPLVQVMTQTLLQHPESNLRTMLTGLSLTAPQIIDSLSYLANHVLPLYGSHSSEYTRIRRALDEYIQTIALTPSALTPSLSPRLLDPLIIALNSVSTETASSYQKWGLLMKSQDTTPQYAYPASVPVQRSSDLSVNGVRIPQPLDDTTIANGDTQNIAKESTLPVPNGWYYQVGANTLLHQNGTFFTIDSIGEGLLKMVTGNTPHRVAYLRLIPFETTQDKNNILIIAQREIKRYECSDQVL